MTLGNQIAKYRKKLNITQDALAQKLGVTNQAVSKWESDQCCPDVMLLPKLADIFGITIDELFGREVPPTEEPKTEEKKSGFEKMFGISLAELDKIGNQKKREFKPEEPTWPDDNILRVAMYVGRKMVCGGPAQYDYHYDGTVDGVLSCGNISCGDVMGDVDAGGNVSCGNVGGDVDAGGNINCGDVGGDVDAGTDVTCGNVGGDVDAGCTVECGQVGGNIDANGPVTIRK